MRRQRYTNDQIQTILLEASNAPIADVAARYGVTVQSIYRWRRERLLPKNNDYGNLSSVVAENARLKKLLADRDLEIEVMKEYVFKRR